MSGKFVSKKLIRNKFISFSVLFLLLIVATIGLSSCTQRAADRKMSDDKLLNQAYTANQNPIDDKINALCRTTIYEKPALRIDICSEVKDKRQLIVVAYDVTEPDTPTMAIYNQMTNLIGYCGANTNPMGKPLYCDFENCKTFSNCSLI